MNTALTDRMAQVPLDELNLFDRDPDPAFDRVTKAITDTFQIPVALLSVVDVDGDRQFFKSMCGLASPWLERQETPLSHSFCQYVVATESPLVVPDARENELVSCNLAIKDLGVIAYLGVPVMRPGGECVAALCAIDTQPHDWRSSEVALMGVLSDGISARLAERAAYLCVDVLPVADHVSVSA